MYTFAYIQHHINVTTKTPKCTPYIAQTLSYAGNGASRERERNIVNLDNCYWKLNSHTLKLQRNIRKYVCTYNKSGQLVSACHLGCVVHTPTNVFTNACIYVWLLACNLRPKSVASSRSNNVFSFRNCHCCLCSFPAGESEGDILTCTYSVVANCI